MFSFYQQARQSVTARLLEKYAVLPLYLRARVEGWDMAISELCIGAHLGTEQVVHVSFIPQFMCTISIWTLPGRMISKAPFNTDMTRCLHGEKSIQLENANQL